MAGSKGGRIFCFAKYYQIAFPFILLPAWGGGIYFCFKEGAFLFVGFCFFFFFFFLLGELGLRRCFALGFVFPSVLGIKLGALHMLGRRSPRELWPQPCLFQGLSKYSTVWTLRSCGRLLRSAGIAGVATTPIRGGVFSGCALQQRGAPRPSLATRNSSSFFLIGEETLPSPSAPTPTLPQTTEGEKEREGKTVMGKYPYMF